MPKEPTTPLGRYIETMRKRHPGVSRRAMALRAGLPANSITKFVNYGVTPMPGVLRRLANAWGRNPAERESDYRQLLDAAGYLYEPATGGSPDSFEELLRAFLQLSRQDREDWSRRILEMLSENGAQECTQQKNPPG